MQIKSAWTSQTNLAQLVGAMAIVAALFGIDLEPETQVKIVAAIGLLVQGFTWMRRTFFTASITPSVAKKLGV